MNGLIPQEWIDEQNARAKAATGGFKKPNPCVRTYGLGPLGRSCGDCRLIRRIELGKIYSKCLLRGDTRGPGTDHLVRWPACSKFVDTKRTVPMNHRLKIVSPHYESQLSGVKQWELREEDSRFFIEGDVLELEHWAEGARVQESPLLIRDVLAVTRGPTYGLRDGWIILSTRKTWGCT